MKNSRFARKLNKYIHDYHITKKDVAKFCDVSCQTVYDWCSGDYMPSFPKLIMLAYLFDTSVDELQCEDGAHMWLTLEDYQKCHNGI